MTANTDAFSNICEAALIAICQATTALAAFPGLCGAVGRKIGQTIGGGIGAGVGVVLGPGEFLSLLF